MRTDSQRGLEELDREKSLISALFDLANSNMRSFPRRSLHRITHKYVEESAWDSHATLLKDGLTFLVFVQPERPSEDLFTEAGCLFSAAQEAFKTSSTINT